MKIPPAIFWTGRVLSLSLLMYVVISIVKIGGFALSGQVVNGQYFVGNHGQFTQVSAQTYYLSLWIGSVLMAVIVIYLLATFSYYIYQKMIKPRSTASK